MEKFIVTNEWYTLSESVKTGKINGFLMNQKPDAQSKPKQFLSKKEAEDEAEFCNSDPMAIANLGFLMVKPIS